MRGVDGMRAAIPYKTVRIAVVASALLTKKPGRFLMRKHLETNTSVWTDVTAPELEALDGDQTTDVCVIGAGIAGLTTAYLLSGMDRSVIVLDDGPVAGGETRRTTAHLANALDDRY